MAPKRSFRQISDHESTYLQLLLADRDADSRKFALERIAKLYRDGHRFKNPERILPHVVFLINDEHERVRRWAFNALALIGTYKQVPQITAALEKQRASPDVLAAAIAALSAISDVELTRGILRRADLPLEGSVLLAAAQQNPAFHAELVRTRVGIDAASPGELRLATLLTGLKKAPEYLFSDKYLNKDMIGQLNQHDDELVSQYSVWSIYEDPRMGYRDLSIDLRNIRGYHPGIRKYAYRILTKSKASAKRNYDSIVYASEDDDTEARGGLAVGLRDLFFDGVDELVLTWFRDEETELIRNRLLEHMAVNVDRAPVYRSELIAAYEKTSVGSIARTRLEAAASGTSMFQEFKRIEFESGMSDMFDDGDNQSQRGSKVFKKVKFPDPTSVKVLIVTALPKEAAAVRATFQELKRIGVAGDPSIYNIGVLNDSDDSERFVIQANSGMGTLNASTLGANALRSFKNIEHIIMVGIAGGCPSVGNPEHHVRLGDIVYSNSDAGIVEYDFVKDDGDNQVIRRTPQRPSAMLSSAAAELSVDAIGGSRPWEAEIENIIVKLGASYERPSAMTDRLFEGDVELQHPDDPFRDPSKPKVLAGVIGSADVLLKNNARRDDLRERFGMRAVEMESSGLQNSAWAQGKDIFVVRGICDYCDGNKDDAWQNYAAAAAAAFTRSLVEAMPLEWFA